MLIRAYHTKMNGIKRTFQKYGIMGHPIQHSLSPIIHHQFAKQFGLNISYEKIQPALNQFTQAVMEFRSKGGLGLNVTLPFKEQAYALCTKTSDRATIAKSVNTILFEKKGEIYGDNTDGIGLIHDITKNLCYNLHKKTILILGAGGAVRGILHPLLMQSPTKIIIANRTLEKAKQLENEFNQFGHVMACGLNDLEHLNVDVILDGTAFDAAFSVPSSLSFSEYSLFYDLKYHSSTLHHNWARKMNPNIITDGWGMLVEQAAEAFFVWTKLRPMTDNIKIDKE